MRVALNSLVVGIVNETPGIVTRISILPDSVPSDLSNVALPSELLVLDTQCISQVILLDPANVL